MSGELITIGIIPSPEITVNSTVLQTTNDHWKLFVSLIAISAVFLLVTIVIFLLVWEKHNCHGWTQFSYLVALLLFDCFFFVALLPGLTDGMDRNAFCKALSILNQYFFVSAKTWLIIISIDLYSTIRKMRIIANNRSKNLTRFVIYSVIGWIMPFFFVLAGVILNWKNRKILPAKTMDEGLWASFPDYGFMHCRIPTWIVWECFVFGNCIFHLFMFGLITITIFWERCAMSFVEASSNLRKSSPFIMLLRLFIVVGISWSYIAVQDLLRAGSINTKQSWGWQFFRCIYFLQGAFISVLILSNRRIIRDLAKKYPKLKGVQIFMCKLKLRCGQQRKESLRSCDSRQSQKTVSSI